MQCYNFSTQFRKIISKILLSKFRTNCTREWIAIGIPTTVFSIQCFLILGLLSSKWVLKNLKIDSATSKTQSSTLFLNITTRNSNLMQSLEYCRRFYSSILKRISNSTPYRWISIRRTIFFLKEFWSTCKEFAYWPKNEECEELNMELWKKFALHTVYNTALEHVAW